MAGCGIWARGSRVDPEPSEPETLQEKKFGGESKYIRDHFHQRCFNNGDYKTVSTQAFGRINFKKDAKISYEPPYICVDETDSTEDMHLLLFKHWKLPKPKLVVSIVGGAKRFQFDKSRTGNLFKQRLLELTTTTGAWIITPGSNNGVYEMVGSAVKDHLDATGSISMAKSVLLGIAAWGSVADRDKLFDKRGKGRFPAVYPITEITGKLVNNVKTTEPLDPNHSHFILVDDGSRDKFDGESQWRAKFEDFLHSQVLPGNETGTGESDVVNIPLVTLLVNGGDGSLKSCSESLEKCIPLVAVAGSGRAAEVVVLLNQLMQNPSTNQRPKTAQLKEVYSKAMQCEPKHKVIESLDTIAKQHKYISVIDLTQEGVDTVDAGLDRAILSALYHKDDLNISKMKAQMRLAIAWDRVDYAKDEIFNVHGIHYRSFLKEKNFLHEIAVEALLKDLPNFVDLLLEHGLSLSDFVTRERLEKLYTKSMERKEGYSAFVNSLFRPEATSNKSACCALESVAPQTDYMHRIGGMLKNILGYTNKGGYTYPNIYKTNEQKTSGKEVFKDPAQHLFLWAVIFNKMELAKLFWRLSEDNIAGAIVGAAILRGMSRKSNQQEGIDITESYLTNSLKFERLANGILKCCCAENKRYTSDMLVREAPNWGNTTVLSMAYHGEMEEFLAQPACYTKLSEIWRGDIALRTHIAWIVIFAVVPFTAFMLKFVRKRDGDARTDERQEDEVSGDTLKPHIITVTPRGRGEDEISYPLAICRGIRSPIVKCICSGLWFFAFLIVYALFMMSELKPYVTASSNSTCSVEQCCIGKNIGCLEIITYCYALFSFQDEMRQIWLRGTITRWDFKLKLRNWFKDYWNIVDSLAYILLIIAAILRFRLTPYYFDWARWFYSFSFMVYVIRFTQVFYVVEQLGPKIIMIKKMLVDLLFFVIILTMTILIFGVVTQTILYPESKLEWDLVNRVVYKPYFQMYGELFLDEYQGYKSLLLAFYMILTNILLLNLLIAMFSYTFEKVQEKADVVWKYNYYAVVYEHFDRPIIPLLGTIRQMLRYCKCARSNGCAPSISSDFRKNLDETSNSNITKFVNLCTEKYIADERKQKSEDMASKYKDSKLEKLEAQLQNLEAKIDRLLNPTKAFTS